MGTSDSSLQDMEIEQSMNNEEKFKAFVIESNTKKVLRLLTKVFLTMVMYL